METKKRTGESPESKRAKRERLMKLNDKIRRELNPVRVFSIRF